MLHRALHTVSLFCCLIVAASFVLFAHDQVAGASQHQAAAVVGPTAVASTTVSNDGAATVHHGQPRIFIDGVTKTLTAPFASLVNSSNPWVGHGVPAALALVVYGLGLGLIARYAREQTYQPNDPR